MKNSETELKLVYKNKKSVVSIIKEIGAKKKSSFKLHDIYFGKEDMSNKNQLLRLRSRDKNYELTFKGKCKSKGHIWKRTEITVPLQEIKKIQQILNALNFRKISENKSRREIWDLNGLEIVFIDFFFPKKIKIIEIEGKKSKIQSTFEKLKDVATPVGEDIFEDFDN